MALSLLSIRNLKFLIFVFNCFTRDNILNLIKSSSSEKSYSLVPTGLRIYLDSICTWLSLFSTFEEKVPTQHETFRTLSKDFKEYIFPFITAIVVKQSVGNVSMFLPNDYI